MYGEVMTFIAECIDLDDLQDIIDNAEDRKKTLEIYMAKEK